MAEEPPKPSDLFARLVAECSTSLLGNSLHLPVPKPEPPPTMQEALIRAYRDAWGDFNVYLPHGVPVSEFDPVFMKDAVFEMAVESARQHFETFLPALFLNHVAKAIACAALVDACREMATYEPDPPGSGGPLTVNPFVPPNPPNVTDSTASSAPAIDWQFPEPWRPLDDAIKVAFVHACHEYNYDFPIGTPFETLGPDVRDVFFSRGWSVAFRVLTPVLSRETALKVAEAISEAAWQVRARALATPRFSG